MNSCLAPPSQAREVLRSLLFVPADRPERFDKAAASGADAVILDLEDSVAAGNKARARQAVVAWLRGERRVRTLVRVNPLGGEFISEDLDMLRHEAPDGILLPKSEGAHSVLSLIEQLGDAAVPILPIATETAKAVFGLGSYSEIGQSLLGLTWGAEDLPAAIGAVAVRRRVGYTPPYEVVRALTLFGAHAAGVAAIETVFPDIADAAGLARYVARARADGFTAMMAIHPSQISVINSGFSPSEAEIVHARSVVDAFAAHPGAGALRLDGKMVDQPHLLLAQRILAQIKVLGQ